MVKPGPSHRKRPILILGFVVLKNLESEGSWYQHWVKTESHTAKTYHQGLRSVLAECAESHWESLSLAYPCLIPLTDTQLLLPWDSEIRLRSDKLQPQIVLGIAYFFGR